MTQEEKDLLLKDLCARLPYGVIVHCKGEYQKYHKVEEIDVRDEVIRCFECMHLYEESIINCFPYLRPMSSMTEEEKKEYQSLCEIHTEHDADDNVTYYYFDTIESMDWLNKNMFDFRGLIDKGRALSTETINPYKN